MAVLHRAQTPLRVPLRTPPDFGLSLLVTAIFGGIVLLLILGATTIPTRGPQGESHAPQGNTTYTDIQAAPPAQPSTILPQH